MRINSIQYILNNHCKFEQTFKDATELHKNISANLEEAEKNEEIARKNLGYWLLKTMLISIFYNKLHVWNKNNNIE